jgi:transposase
MIEQATSIYRWHMGPLPCGQRDAEHVVGNELKEESLMTIVGGLDLHRRQITFDYLQTSTGELRRGRIIPADRRHLRAWLAWLPEHDGEFAVEGCTGWRFVVEELAAAQLHPHLAEPAETATARGRKRRAKTDRGDACWQRELLLAGVLPESWIPPTHVLEGRALVRLYVDLLSEHNAWRQRLHATLFHLGVPATSRLTPELLDQPELSPAGRDTAAAALRQLDRLAGELDPLRRRLHRYATRQPGCRALQTHYGIGPLTGVAIWEELGDARRFSSSRDAVRHAGLDITVHSSDTTRARGHLSRQGPAVLRWALFEAALRACNPTSPDHGYYSTVKQRLGSERATLSVARKLVRRCHHTLRALGDEAWAPAKLD